MVGSQNWGEDGTDERRHGLGTFRGKGEVEGVGHPKGDFSPMSWIGGRTVAFNKNSWKVWGGKRDPPSKEKVEGGENQVRTRCSLIVTREILSNTGG